MFNYSVDHDTIASVLDLMERTRPKFELPCISGISIPKPARAREFKSFKRVSPQVNAQIASLSRQNLGQIEIAARLGISQTTVSKRLCRMGLRRHKFKNRLEKQAA